MIAMRKSQSSHFPVRWRQSEWTASSWSVPGSYHLRDKRPCQDAVMAGVEPLPYLVVCDGRGSASRSEVGAQRAVHAFEDLLSTQRSALSSVLDQGSCRDPARIGRWSQFVHGVVMRRLLDVTRECSLEHGLPMHEFEFTFSAAIIGRRHIGWIQLGDSSLVMLKANQARLIGEIQRGEYANETFFVSLGSVAASMAQTGLISRRLVSAVFGFTDGASEGLLDGPRRVPSSTFGEVTDAVIRGQKLNGILQTFLNHKVWDRLTGDDRSLGVLVRK